MPGSPTSFLTIRAAATNDRFETEVAEVVAGHCFWLPVRSPVRERALSAKRFVVSRSDSILRATFSVHSKRVGGWPNPIMEPAFELRRADRRQRHFVGLLSRQADFLSAYSILVLFQSVRVDACGNGRRVFVLAG